MRLFATVLVFLVTCAIGWTADLVPFAPPWDDATPGPTNISGTLDKPAGKSGFVHVKDGHLYAGDHRLRLFGSNFTAAADFPDHETAAKVAARMAKFGLNAVRFHFLDATWGTPRLINYESGDCRNWNADALDRLDYFIARLKEQGIYADLNLLVGRRFGVGDGVDAKVNQLDWKAAHAVGFFHAPHMEAQKRYARQLLTHLNPYTKLTYAEDPAVALVEINNENGLIHTWMGGGFDALPDVFAQDLRQQWNAWLAQTICRHGGALQGLGARDEPLAAEMLANAGLARNLEGWNVEQHEGAAVDSSVEGGTAVLRVRKPGTAGWHVQFNQSKLAVKRGRRLHRQLPRRGRSPAQGEPQPHAGPRSLGEPGPWGQSRADQGTAAIHVHLHRHRRRRERAVELQRHEPARRRVPHRRTLPQARRTRRAGRRRIAGETQRPRAEGSPKPARCRPADAKTGSASSGKPNANTGPGCGGS